MIWELTIEQVALANLMSDISEKCYCAGWMPSLEYILWDCVINGERKYGQDQVTTEDIESLKSLSGAARCWIIFDDETELTPVSLDKWKNVFTTDIERNPSLLNG